MVKYCDRCQERYAGFGATCATCRKSSTSLLSSAPRAYDAPNVCEECHKKVYLVEKLVVDDSLFHAACFRCNKCQGQLSLTNFARCMKTGKYLCIPHSQESFRRRGRFTYALGGPQDENMLAKMRSLSCVDEEDENENKQLTTEVAASNSSTCDTWRSSHIQESLEECSDEEKEEEEEDNDEEKQPSSDESEDEEELAERAEKARLFAEMMDKKKKQAAMDEMMYAQMGDMEL